jgi:predicted porin
MVYFSPNFAGFSFALSYAPDGTEDTRGFVDGFGTRSDSDPLGAAGDSEEYSAAIQFVRDFNGVNVAVGGGAAYIDDIEGDGLGFIDEGDIDKPIHYNAYAQVGVGIGDGMLTVGAAWAARNNFANFASATVVPGGGTVVTAVHDGLDNMVWAVGVVYGLDAWKVGVSYSHGDYESACTGVFDDDECEDDHDIVTVDANYALGPGVDVGAMVE